MALRLELAYTQLIIPYIFIPHSHDLKHVRELYISYMLMLYKFNRRF